MHLYFVNFSHCYRNIYTYVRVGVKDCVIDLYLRACERVMAYPGFSDHVLFCFPETQWGHFNNGVSQAPEPSALCGVLPARQRPAN